MSEVRGLLVTVNLHQSGEAGQVGEQECVLVSQSAVSGFGTWRPPSFDGHTPRWVYRLGTISGTLGLLAVELDAAL